LKLIHDRRRDQAANRSCCETFPDTAFNSHHIDLIYILEILMYRRMSWSEVISVVAATASATPPTTFQTRCPDDRLDSAA